MPGACNDDIDGGVAFEGTTAYLPCLSGTIAVSATTSPARLRLLWTSSVGGGPPILAGGMVWTVGQDGVLYGLNPTTGAVRRHVSVGAPANHFPTPSVGAGLFLVPTAHRVVAFSTSAGIFVVALHFDIRRTDEHLDVGPRGGRHRRCPVDLVRAGRGGRRPGGGLLDPALPAQTPEELTQIRNHLSDLRAQPVNFFVADCEGP